jgi:hypothetical protein
MKPLFSLHPSDLTDEDRERCQHSQKNKTKEEKARILNVQIFYVNF